MKTILIAAVLVMMPRVNAQTVTYAHDVAPILYTHCTGCHHAGGSGPFPLMTYADAKRWSRSIEAVTASRYMPPWLPEPGHGEFQGNRRLADAVVALIRRWLEAGSLEGDAAAKPAAPVYASDWELGPPDLLLEVDSPMHVPASGTDLFRNFVLPFPLKESRYVRAMEIKPGSPQVVHHANLILDRTASLRRQHPEDWRDGIPGMDVLVDAGEGFDPDGYFLDWKPDSTALVEPPGMAWRLDPGNDLVLNMHLKPTGKVESVRARIGLYFTDKAPTKLPILVQLESDGALNIPAGDADFVVEDHVTLPVATSVLAIYPHAHYLGKRMEGWAELPDHSRKELILIPSWDINRQAIYRYTSPVALPAGSTLHMRYSYDNSAANPHNPNSPPVRVMNGNRSVDEMSHLWVQLVPEAVTGSKADPRAPILRAWMQSELRKNPQDPIALFNLASLDMQEDRADAAVPLFEKALSARPRDARTLTALGSALVKTGDWQGARQQFTAATVAEPDYIDAHFDLASVDLQHDRVTEAEAEFRKTLALSPADAESLFQLATIEANSGRVADAVQHLSGYVKQRPADVDARRGLIALYGAEDNLADAIREERLLLEKDGSQANDWNDLGAMLARSGRREEAAVALHHAIQLDPRNAAAQANLNRLKAKP
jgi:Flp pilus assembly protein TadD